jgi:imidazolonepropionase
MPIAIASDYNPGSSPSGNINLVVSLACIKMKILPHQAFNAATINGAYAMDLAQNMEVWPKEKRQILLLQNPFSLSILFLIFWRKCN